SKDEEDEEVVFEGVKKLEKKIGQASVSAKRDEKSSKVNGIAHGSRSSPEPSSEDDEEDEDEESETDQSVQIPVFRKEDGKQDDAGADDILSNIHFQRRDDPRALLTHETMCALRHNIDSLNEPRDPDHTSTSVNGVVLPDPIHAIQAMDHNLWVLASAASLRLNEVGDRCKQLMNRTKHEQNKKHLTEVLPKALAALSGQQIGFKEKEPEKPAPKGKNGRIVPAAVPVTKPVTRERPVRERAEPKKKLPLIPKEILKDTVASPRPTSVMSPRVATPALIETPKNGKAIKERVKEEEVMATANTRKRKQAKEQEEKEVKKDIKASVKATKGGNTAKRSSNRTAKKTKDDEPTYCHCNRISFGEMVGCDNEKCAIEWFHFECINIKVKPKGKWYCPDCRVEPNNSKQPK
ncbi:hypothetical protein PENTCL1PPCAC_10880, partial [Pristionchus entomophagus]